MTRGSRGTRESTHSSLLTPEENERVEELLGRRCASVAKAVVQLFMALPHCPSMWSLQITGVVSFVKDNPQRSYFIRVFDLKTGCQFWEQELYSQFVYNCPRPYFHTFTADDCQVGLSFASTQEADIFQRVVDEKISQRNTRHEKAQRPPPSNDRGAPPLPNNKGFSTMATVDIPNPDNQASRFRSMQTHSLTPLAQKGKKEKKGKKKAPKLSKADIGAPSGFTHVSHVGWDPNSMDPDLLKLLSSAGIGEAEMKDEETSQLIFNIIQQSGGMEAVKKEVNRVGAPPLPQHGRQGPLPPTPGLSSSHPSRPPARRSGPLPPLPGQSPQRGGAPPPPPPAHGGPPPPPPPTSRGGYAPPPPPQSRSSSHPPPPPKTPGPSFPPPPMPSYSPTPPAPPPPPPAHSFAGPPHPHLNAGSAHFPAPPPPPPPPPPQPLHGSQDFPGPPPPFGGSRAAGGGGEGGGGGAEVGDGRGALLSQIRLGKKLKNVAESPETATPASPGGGEGIVGALMMVMQKRSKAIHSSDDDDGDCVDDDDEDDEWDD